MRWPECDQARAVLADQPLPDPPGRMPLFAWHVPVREQSPVDDGRVRPIAGRGRGGYAFRGGGTALARGLPHGPPVHMMPDRQFPDR